MKRGFFHRAVQIILLGVMVLTSSGYTVVVGHCSMSDSPVCCCGNDPAHRSSVPEAGQALRNLRQSCYSESVLGGAHDIHAVVASESAAKAVAQAVDREAPGVQHVDLSQQTPLSSRLDVDVGIPPDSDIYIQVRSLLI